MNSRMNTNCISVGSFGCSHSEKPYEENNLELGLKSSDLRRSNFSGVFCCMRGSTVAFTGMKPAFADLDESVPSCAYSGMIPTGPAILYDRRRV